MMIVSRRFPRSSAGLLVLGIGAVFLAAAAPPAQKPVAPPASSVLPGMAPSIAPAPAPVPAPASASPSPAAAVQTKEPVKPEQISITIDQTRMVDLDGPVSTVSVGNPAIADVTVQDKRLFLIGKSFGRTNVVALSPTGDTVMNMMVFVTSTGGGSVTVYKGNRQLTYNCAPNCDRTLMPGDSKDDFDTISSQMSTKMESGSSKRNE